MKRFFNWQAGFTFLELIIVIAITFIVGITAVPFYSRFFNQTSVTNTTDQFIAELRKAQLYSIVGKRGGQWGVAYNSSKIILFQGSTYASRNTAFDETFSIDPNISVTGFTELAFNRMTGTPSASQSITITGIGGNAKTISVTTQGVISKATWFNTSFVYKKTITIDHTKVSGGSDLSNFPVLISVIDPNLRTVSNGGFVQNSSGFDILFTDTTQTIKLDHEIEKYVPSTGEIEMWVRLPSLYATTDTVIYMYYDNTAISSSQENKNGVWNSNYKAVWHLKETSGSQTDSTSNSNNTDSISVVSQGAATGKVDGADQLSSATGFMSAPHASSLLPANVSVSAWVNFSQLSSTGGNDQAIVGQNNTTSPYWAYTLSLATVGNHFCFNWYNTSATSYYVCSNIAAAINTWYYVTGVYNGNTLKIYINGTDDSSSVVNPTGTILQADYKFFFGNGNSLYNPNGIFDEVRVAGTGLTSGWLTTEYNNQNSPSTFYAIGSATTQ